MRIHTPSNGEKKLMAILRQLNIGFKTEHSFPALINPKTGCSLYFDFYIKSYNLVIELDGAHHFRPINGEKALDAQKYRDRIKNKFCKENKLKIVRLLYSDLRQPFSKLKALFGKPIRIKKVNNMMEKMAHLPIKKVEKMIDPRTAKRMKIAAALKIKNEQWQKDIEEKREAFRKSQG